MDKKIKLGLAIVDNKTIKNFNRTYKKSNYETDVLAFESQEDLPDGYHFLGDIMISSDKIKENAKRYQVTEAEELARVVTHGVLHLLGYRDEKEKERNKMKSIEDKIVKTLKEN